MKKSSLTVEALSGIFWQSTSAAGSLLIRTAVVIILARHLKPEDFGIVAAAMLIAVVTQAIAQGGIPKALVQRLTLDEHHLRAAFAIAFYSGLLAAALLWLGAPQFAALLGIARAEQVIRLFSVLVLLSGINAVSTAMLRRERRFRLSSGLDLIAFSIGYGAVGLGMAFNGFGMWSLAAAHVCQMILRTIMFMYAARTPVSFWPKPSAARDLYVSGSGYSVGTLGNIAATQADTFVVGRLLGADALGLYNRAITFVILPTNLIGAPSQTVLFSSMSSVQDQPERVARAFMRGIGVIAMATLPLSGVLMILAPELVIVTLGAKWQAMTVPFQILAATLFFRTSYKISDAVSLAMGSSYQRALRQWAYAAAVAAGAAAGARWGLPGVAVGVGGAVLANYLLMLQLALRLTQVPVRLVARMHLRHVAAAVPVIAITAVAAAAARAQGVPDPAVLACGLGAAGTVFALMWWKARGIFGEDGAWVHQLASSRFKRPAKSAGGA
jgi:PST family polysaccharide transporter